MVCRLLALLLLCFSPLGGGMNSLSFSFRTRMPLSFIDLTLQFLLFGFLFLAYT